MIDASMANSGRKSDVPDVLGFLRGVAGNLREGTRIAFFRPFSGTAFRVGAWHLLALAAIDVAITVAFDYVSVEPERFFSSFGFMGMATGYLLFVFAIFAIAGILSDKGGTPRILVSVLATGPAVSLVMLPLTWAFVHFEIESVALALAIYLGWIAWTFAILYRVLGERYHLRRARKVALVLLYAGLCVVPRLFLQETPFWYSYNLDDYASEETTSTVNTEDVYYAQPALLARSAAALAAQRPGIADLYFVGFGSYASQDVFMNEVNYVRALFDARFDTRGRSLALINNEKTVDEVPLANRSNLRITLGNVAARMDIDEDVLFLFLTSHGSDDAVLSVDFWPLDPNHLTADDLRAALDESGIKWRILVISACYSGSFIETLRDDYTLIFTAAAHDKKSFGCSDDREMTYFGEHFFAKALSQGGSLVDAFRVAQASLRARELEEQIEPSEPQMHMGAAMEAKLETLEARLRRASQTMAQAPAPASGHCDQHAARAREGLSPVEREHVVEDQQIACLPGEDDLRRAVR